MYKPTIKLLAVSAAVTQTALGVVPRLCVIVPMPLAFVVTVSMFDVVFLLSPRFSEIKMFDAVLLLSKAPVTLPVRSLPDMTR